MSESRAAETARGGADQANAISCPVSRSHIIWRTAENESVDVLRCDYFLEPHRFVLQPHVHQRQEEWFEVVSGRMHIRLGREVRALNPGESILVSPGVSHTFWNEEEKDLHVVIEFRPALGTREFFETHFRLAALGKISKGGFPKTLRSAWEIATAARRAEAYHSRFPIPLQRAAMAGISALGRLLRYTTTAA